FVLEGIPLTLRGVSSAHVLGDYHVTAPCGLVGELRLLALIVGSAHQKHRKSSLGFGPVDVRVQDHSVSHLGRHALLLDDLVVLRAQRRDGSPSGKQQKSASYSSHHSSSSNERG